MHEINLARGVSPMPMDCLRHRVLVFSTAAILLLASWLRFSPPYRQSVIVLTRSMARVLSSLLLDFLLWSVVDTCSRLSLVLSPLYLKKCILTIDLNSIPKASFVWHNKDVFLMSIKMPILRLLLVYHMDISENSAFEIGTESVAVRITGMPRITEVSSIKAMAGLSGNGRL